MIDLRIINTLNYLIFMFYIKNHSKRKKIIYDHIILLNLAYQLILCTRHRLTC